MCHNATHASTLWPNHSRRQSTPTRTNLKTDSTRSWVKWRIYRAMGWQRRAFCANVLIMINSAGCLAVPVPFFALKIFVALQLSSFSFCDGNNYAIFCIYCRTSNGNKRKQQLPHQRKRSTQSGGLISLNVG